MFQNILSNKHQHCVFQLSEIILQWVKNHILTSL